MSANTLKILIAGALFVHGVGHTLGFWKPSRSWLLHGLDEPTLRAVSSVFWTLSAIGFIAACLGFLGIAVPHDMWRTIAIIFACVSLAGLVIFWGNWPVFNVIGAISMNVATLVTQIWLKWPDNGT